MTQSWTSVWGKIALIASGHGYAESAQVARDILSGFVWAPHMRQHGLAIEGPSMSDGLTMEM